MNVHFETKKAFSIAGLTAPNSESGDFSGLWNKLFAQVPHEILTSLGSGESFGTCYNYHTIPNNFNYMAGYSTLLPEKAREIGLEVLDIPEAGISCSMSSSRRKACATPARPTMNIIFLAICSHPITRWSCGCPSRGNDNCSFLRHSLVAWKGFWGLLTDKTDWSYYGRC